MRASRCGRLSFLDRRCDLFGRSRRQRRRGACPSAPAHRGGRARAPAWSGARRRVSTRRARWLWLPRPASTATAASPAPLCGSRTAISASERPDNDKPRRDHRGREQQILPVSRVFCRPGTCRSPRFVRGINGCHARIVPGNRAPARRHVSRQRYSSSSPASPSSAANASSVPLAFQASAETGAVPFLRTRISAPSFSRTIRMVPSL